MISRRQFLGRAAIASAAAFIDPKMTWANGRHRLNEIGIQLYTIRELMKADFEGTLAKVAQIGYKEVEFAGYFGREPKQVCELLKKNNLKSPSCHVQYELISDNAKLQENVKNAKTIGHSYLILPWIPEPLRKTLDDWKRVARLLNRVGEMAVKEGMHVGYHNHWFEFIPIEGKLPYDLLLDECDPKFVAMELDLCWIASTGTDPIKYFNKYKGRFPLVHVKDLTRLPKPGEKDAALFQSPVGKGILDWKCLLAKAEETGTKHFFVEQDAPKDASNDIQTSFDYLKKLSW